jgi:nitroreductase
MFHELVRKNRSYRRFDEDTPIQEELLKKLVDLTRYTASGANRQALRYVVSATAEMNDKIFPQLAWAGYFKDWAGPSEGERPTGYIIIAQQESCKANPYDVGIAAQTILLGAVEAGFGGCMLQNIQYEKLQIILKLPADIHVLLVIALGKPKEEVVLEEMHEGSNDIKYYRDENAVHHVPKRSLRDILLG